MKKNETDNVKIYFICDRKENMSLIESYYDKKRNTHYWYFNAYLAYQAWKNNFKDIEGDLAKMLLTVAASRYLIYKIEGNEIKTEEELNQIKQDMKKINPKLEKIINENKILLDL